MRYEFFRALSALRFKSALSAYEPTMGPTVKSLLLFAIKLYSSRAYTCNYTVWPIMHEWLDQEMGNKLAQTFGKKLFCI